jgi:GPH family glycoside/pentoside/hexuronide:cation symporter
MPMPEETKTPTPEPLARKAIVAWSLGSLAEQMMSNIIGYLAMPIYNIALGVDVKLLGWAMGLPRVLDAVLDPVMGNLSDNTRHKLGRRRPYIFLGAILCGLTFAMLWSPPSFLSKTGLGYYFMIVALLFYIAYTVFAVPWSALGMELTTDYHGRTRVMAYRTFMGSIGGMVVGCLWWLSFKFGGGNEVKGVRVVAIIFGIYVAISALLPAIFCREATHVQSQKQIRLWPAITATLRNKTFLQLSFIILFLLLGLFLVNPFSNYINIYYVFGGHKDSVSTLNMIANGVFQGVGLLLTPFAAWLGFKFGKKRALMIGLVSVIIAYCTSWVTYNPRHPYWQLITLALAAPGLSCVWVLSSSMLADICDVDELHTHMRREGMYGAVFSWLCKAGIAGTLILSGYMLNWSGFDVKLPQQTPDTIFTMRLLYMVVPVTFICLAFVLTCFYPIDEKTALDVRRQLSARKQALPPDPAAGDATETRQLATPLAEVPQCD